MTQNREQTGFMSAEGDFNENSFNADGFRNSEQAWENFLGLGKRARERRQKRFDARMARKSAKTDLLHAKAEEKRAGNTATLTDASSTAATAASLAAPDPTPDPNAAPAGMSQGLKIGLIIGGVVVAIGIMFLIVRSMKKGGTTTTVPAVA